MPTMTATDKTKDPKLAPPSTPMLQPKADEPADIPDPPVPQEALQEPDASKTVQDASGSTQAPKTTSTLSHAEIVATIHQHEALLHGAAQYITEKVHKGLAEEKQTFDRMLDRTCEVLKAWVEKQAQQNEHAQYSLADALQKIREQGLGIFTFPYQVDVQAKSPQGFDVRVIVARKTDDELFRALPALLTWMHEQGYKGTV